MTDPTVWDEVHGLEDREKSVPCQATRPCRNTSFRRDGLCPAHAAIADARTRDDPPGICAAPDGSSSVRIDENRTSGA